MMTDQEVQKAWMLLQVAEASLKFPQLKWLHDRALAELTAMERTEEPELPIGRRV